MIIENQTLIYTGYELRNGKNGDYYLFKFLDESGDSFSVMLDKTVNPQLLISKLSPLKEYKCKFRLNLGRYVNLILLEVDVIKNNG